MLNRLVQHQAAAQLIINNSGLSPEEKDEVHAYCLRQPDAYSQLVDGQAGSDNVDRVLRALIGNEITYARCSSTYVLIT